MTERMAPPPHMCGICRRVLTPVDVGTGPIVWSHGLQVDHETVPVPQNDPVLVCDFCSAPDSTWSAECEPFVASAAELLPELDFDQMDNGLWLACDPCASYIQRNDWPRLLYRAEKHFTRVTGEPAIGRFVAHMHDRFRQNFTGVVTPIRDD